MKIRRSEIPVCIDSLFFGSVRLALAFRRCHYHDVSLLRCQRRQKYTLEDYLQRKGVIHWVFCDCIRELLIAQNR